MRGVLGAGCACLVLCVLAGCGGSGGDSSSADQAAKDTYVAKGNAVCRRAEVRYAKAFQRLQRRADNGKPNPSSAVISSNLPRSGPAAIYTLQRPPVLRAELDEVFAPAQELEKLSKNEKHPGVVFSARARRLLSDQARNLSDYGLTECAAAVSRSIAAQIGAQAGQPLVGGGSVSPP